MNIKHLLMASAILISANYAFGQGMAVNTSDTTADLSAILDVSSTSQGMLVPRLTAAQKPAISSPVQVY
jgi:hypothetical protein